MKEMGVGDNSLVFFLVLRMLKFLHWHSQILYGKEREEVTSDKSCIFYLKCQAFSRVLLHIHVLNLIGISVW